MTEFRDDLEEEFLEIQGRLADPELIADNVAYAKAARRYRELEAIVERMTAIRRARDDVEAAGEMLSEADNDEREMLEGEITDATDRIDRLDAELTELLLPKDPNDERNVIVEIRGAEGGEEANLFAADLYEMYAAYAATRGWKLERMDARPSDMGGFSQITFRLDGDSVWSRLKYEGGPHRVQRVPATESQGRVHTSSATVSVLPEADEVEVDIDEADLEVDVFRSGGPGGQSVNTTDSAVRITHKPTGLVVSMQDEKSQLQNKRKALYVLRARLFQLEQERQAAELSAQRRDQIGGGGRSEKIRTYNYKENRVSDHRINLTVYKLDRVLAGELDEVVDPMIAHERAAQLAGSAG